MITIDPVDDEVIRKDKIDRRQANRRNGSVRQPAGVQVNIPDKKRRGVLALLVSLLRGKRDEEGCDEYER
jgi:hypothetical protein